MENSEFQNIADKSLGDLAEEIETLDEQVKLDTDLHDGILSVVCDDGAEYVINRHGASQKIWVSSPKSGASYFVFDDKDNQWINDVGEELHAKIVAEIKSILGKN